MVSLWRVCMHICMYVLYWCWLIGSMHLWLLYVICIWKYNNNKNANNLNSQLLLQLHAQWYQPSNLLFFFILIPIDAIFHLFVMHLHSFAYVCVCFFFIIFYADQPFFSGLSGIIIYKSEGKRNERGREREKEDEVNNFRD